MLKLSKNLILASNSPRRHQLLTDAGFEFEIHTKNTDESFDPDMPATDVAGYLAKKKAEAFGQEYTEALLLTADTIVVVDDMVLNKPQDRAEAAAMLERLSGRTHIVYTGVCLKTGVHINCQTDCTKVTFKPLSSAEIDYYIDTCRPFDKAGAYGVQDFIGMVGIEHLDGSFFTVMGLPVHRVYAMLMPYIIF